MIPPPPDSATAVCPARTTGWAALLRIAVEQPAVGLACAGALGEERQDRILREAFASAMVLDKPAAARWLALVANRPWIGEVNFFDAMQVARQAEPAHAEALLIAAAANNPSLAIREIAAYSDLPFAQRVFERAALLVPDEVTAIARVKSNTGAAIRDAMGASALPSIATLRKIAQLESISDLVRERLAILGRAEATPVIHSDSEYFTQLASLRISATGDAALLYDRALEKFSQMLFVEARRGVRALDRMRPQQMTASNAYLLLGYGRTESGDETFAALFDHILAPKLNGESLPKLLRETHSLNLRRFLSAVIAHQHFDALMRLAATEPARLDLLERALSGIGESARPLEAAITAAEVIGQVSSPDRLNHLAAVIQREYEGARPGIASLYGLLAVRLQQQGYEGSAIASIAARYAPYLEDPAALPTTPLFTRDGACVQRHFFYDDEDGVESFANFRRTFQSDASWTWDEHDGWVIVSAASSGRSIRMIANVPIDVLAPANGNRKEEAARRHSAVEKYFAANRLQPTVAVHRGHSYHVEKTLRSLTPSARLVFLGSCNGLTEVDAVMATAAHAQVIATKGIGTQSINDPLLKAINTELLSGVGRIDWEHFWQAQRKKLGGALFNDYIPPQRNSAAIMLAAYHSYLAGAE